MAASPGEEVEAPYLLTDMAADGVGAARPPRHRLGPRRRRVDGRDDRPDDRDRAPGPGPLAHLDHVHHRRARVGQPDARGAAGAASARPPPPRGGHRGRRPHPRLISSPGHFDEAAAGEASRAPTTGACNPVGTARQLLAIVAIREPRRGAAPRSTCRPLVIHGDADPLVRASGGRAHRRADPRRRAARDRGHGPRPAARRPGRRSSTPSPSLRANA